jgi:hypothetical protein
MERPEGKRQLGRPRSREENHIKTDILEVGVGAGTGLIWHRIGAVGRHL